MKIHVIIQMGIENILRHLEINKYPNCAEILFFDKARRVTQSRSFVKEEQRCQKAKDQASGVVIFFHVP